VPISIQSRKCRVAVAFAATIALVTLTGVSASVPGSAQRTQPDVLQMVGSGQNVWMVVQDGSQVALWSTQSSSGPWKHLGWPTGMDPVQLVREHADAWAVSMDNQLYATTNAGATWKSVSLPRRLTVHPHWAQGLRVAPMGSHRLALLAWGGEATFQSAKLLWMSSNNGKSWTLTAHSDAGPVGATAPWWPRKSKPTLPPYGDPVAFHMVDGCIGYLMVTTVGGSFLWETANGGTSWKHVSVRGISPSLENQGITVLYGRH